MQALIIYLRGKLAAWLLKDFRVYVAIVSDGPYGAHLAGPEFPIYSPSEEIKNDFIIYIKNGETVLGFEGKYPPLKSS